jgi:hypothetical protein
MTDTYRASDAPAVVPGVRTDGPVPTPGGPLSYVHWGPVIAGAVLAAASAFVLMTFAASVGLAVASPSPTWRDASIALAILSGLWILLVAIGSFALGGYLAGRVRSTWSTSADEIEFRDGAHGLMVWALAIVIGGFLTWATATTLSSVTAVGATQSRVTAAEAALAYELDRLFRSDKRPEPIDQETRSEAGRILLTGLGREMRAEDRTYLTRLVAAHTGLAPAEAERRVIQVITEARQAARRTRATGIIVGFMTAASLAAGAVAAWLAAGVGGRHRDQSISPPMRWDWRRRAAA